MKTKFNNFLNESLRDKMTPKSEEEVSQATITTVLKTYPNSKNRHDELTDCVNLILDNGYYYKGLNIRDDFDNRPVKDREKDVVWFKYNEPLHFLSMTDNTRLENLKKRLDDYKKRYKL